MNKTPRLRFKEFNGDWENKKVYSVFDRVNNRVDVIETESYKQIGIRSHGKGIFYKDAVSGKDLGNKRVFWIEPDVFIVNIVFAWEQAVAKTTQNEIGMIASHRFPMYKPKKSILDLDYITQVFKTPKGKFLLGLASPGGAGRNKTLGQKEFDNLDITLPSYDEQKKIATFISLIDDKISLQGEKLRMLKDYRKGMMQKIFSRELRFKDDEGRDYPEWEEKKLGDISTIVGGGTPSTTEEQYWNGEIQWFTPTEIKEQKFVSTSMRTITDKGLRKSSAKILPKGTILLTTRASLGDMAIANNEVTTNQGFQSIIVKDNVNNQFIYYLQEKIKKYCYKNASGSTFLEISKKTIENFKLNVPCLEEQNKIVDILSSLDKKIEKEQDKLDSLNEYKKGLLQQMFV